MIEGRPRESLVQYENPIEVSRLSVHQPVPLQISGGQDPNDPFKKSFGKSHTNPF